MTSRRQVLAAAAATAPAGDAQAQPVWSDPPFRLIVPFAAGGNADTIGRIFQTSRTAAQAAGLRPE
jgi:tripartite-type tricarboxylate transporter receptor subunit TctC